MGEDIWEHCANSVSRENTMGTRCLVDDWSIRTRCPSTAKSFFTCRVSVITVFVDRLCVRVMSPRSRFFVSSWTQRPTAIGSLTVDRKPNVGSRCRGQGFRNLCNHRKTCSPHIPYKRPSTHLMCTSIPTRLYLYQFRYSYSVSSCGYVLSRNGTPSLKKNKGKKEKKKMLPPFPRASTIENLFGVVVIRKCAFSRCTFLC